MSGPDPATTEWVPIWNSATEGPAGPPGPEGPPGADGAPGTPGVDGEDGAPGPQGEQGIQGIPGPEGPEGPQGEQGIQGIQGEQGPQGEPGEGGETTDPYSLDYVGEFVPPTVYNDGDIVIGPDGIAYICTKDGVTEAPTPWPGIGISTVVGPPGPTGPQGPPGEDGADGQDGPSVDAQYWTSTSHATLSAERNFGAIASGYVKSVVTAAVSNPITVAVIPLADGGTGASDAPTARTNLGLGTMAVQNSDAVNITGGNMSGNHGGDGRWLSVLDATALQLGTVPTARMGAGTANSATFLRGDQQWAVPPAAAGVPSGMIMMAVGACPPGYTRLVWDGWFIRVGPTPGVTGGAWDHSHGVSVDVPDHTHGAGSFAAASHDHPGANAWGTTDPNGSHHHWFSKGMSIGGDTGENNPTPPNVTYDDGGATRRLADYHRHAWSANFTVEANTTDDGSHAHAFNGSVGIPAQAPAVTGVSGAGGAATAGGGTDARQHLPPFIDVWLCQKD